MLLLIPEDTALPAMATLVASLRSSLWEAKDGPITLDVESLDLGWARGPAYTHALHTWYLAKYRERRPDALIAFRSDAVQLALQLRRELWPRGCAGQRQGHEGRRRGLPHEALR